jgi:GT2 family glycosyltransferase
MVFTKSLLEQSGGFDENLGMMGKKVAYMEEVDFLLKLEQQGIIIYYVHNMKVKHLIADYKMSLEWLLKATYSGGKSAKKTFMKERTWYSHGSAVLKQFTFSLIKFLSPQQLPFKRRVYYALQWSAWELGAFVEHIQK